MLWTIYLHTHTRSLSLTIGMYRTRHPTESHKSFTYLWHIRINILCLARDAFSSTNEGIRIFFFLCPFSKRDRIISTMVHKKAANMDSILTLMCVHLTFPKRRIFSPFKRILSIFIHHFVVSELISSLLSSCLPDIALTRPTNP